MKLVQIFLPRYDNSGRLFAKGLYRQEQQRLVDAFGGMTSYMQTRAQGLWDDKGRTKRDELIVFEVMVRRLDRKWWTDYRAKLRKRFRQKEILIRSQDAKVF